MKKQGFRSCLEKHHFDGYHICYPKQGVLCKCSVIEHEGSYGHDKDLLEIMGLLTEEEKAADEVAGWLTAEDVFGRIKADFDGRSNLNNE